MGWVEVCCAMPLIIAEAGRIGLTEIAFVTGNDQALARSGANYGLVTNGLRQ